MKGAAIVAASGGLVATFAQPAAADGQAQAAKAVVPSSAAVVGPQSATLKAPSALNVIGFGQQATTTKAQAPKPTVIKDIVVEKTRADAKTRAERAAQLRQAASTRASRRPRARPRPGPDRVGHRRHRPVDVRRSLRLRRHSPSGFDCSGFTSWSTAMRASASRARPPSSRPPPLASPTHSRATSSSSATRPTTWASTSARVA